MGNKENNTQGGGREAAAPLGARPKAAPLFSLFPMIFLHKWSPLGGIYPLKYQKISKNNPKIIYNPSLRHFVPFMQKYHEK